jgi:hypothetical protein
VINRSIRSLHCNANCVQRCSKSAHSTAQGKQDPAYQVLGLGLTPKVHHLKGPAGQEKHADADATQTDKTAVCWVLHRSSTQCSAEPCYVKLEDYKQLQVMCVVFEEHVSPESAGHQHSSNTPTAVVRQLTFCCAFTPA